MPIVVGDNAFDYSYEGSLLLTNWGSIRCYGRGCRDFAMHSYRIESGCLKSTAFKSALLLCAAHGRELAAGVGTFMGVVGVYGAGSEGVVCEYSGCRADAARTRIQYAGMSRDALLYLCPTHRPVFGVRRLRPRPRRVLRACN